MVKLILIRHGESIWNLENRFTGWIDISLSQKGIKQAQEAGKKLENENFTNIFTSNLIRAHMTLYEVLNQNKKSKGCIRIHENESKKYHHGFNQTNQYTQLFTTEALNERFYGDLQGKNKEETVKEHGDEQVKLWRRSYDIRPPQGDALKDTAKQTLPYFNNTIKPMLTGTTLIVAHGNSLRSIIMELEQLNEKEILDVEIETGVPIMYELDDNHKILNKTIL